MKRIFMGAVILGGLIMTGCNKEINEASTPMPPIQYTVET